MEEFLGEPTDSDRNDYDLDRDGYLETKAVDTNGDGLTDVVVRDRDGHKDLRVSTGIDPNAPVRHRF